jgi:hypothetical protein
MLTNRLTAEEIKIELSVLGAVDGLGILMSTTQVMPRDEIAVEAELQVKFWGFQNLPTFDGESDSSEKCLWEEREI